MTGTARGAVLREFGRPLKFEDAPINNPEPGALVALVAYGGICGTDATCTVAAC